MINVSILYIIYSCTRLTFNLKFQALLLRYKIVVLLTPRESREFHKTINLVYAEFAKIFTSAYSVKINGI